MKAAVALSERKSVGAARIDRRAEGLLCNCGRRRSVAGVEGVGAKEVMSFAKLTVAGAFGRGVGARGVATAVMAV